MNNQSTTTQPRLWTLILCLLLTIQTACTNGVPHLEADGDEEKIVSSSKDEYQEQTDKFLKRLTREERSFWNSIKDEGFKAAFVEYCYEKGLNKNLSHLHPKGKDPFVEYVLKQNIENKEKSHIIYQYLEEDLSSRVGHIIDHVQDTQKAEKFVKSLCDYLPENYQQYIGYTFCKYANKDCIKSLIQVYILGGLDYKLRSVLLIEGDAELRARLVCGLAKHTYQAGNPEKIILSAMIKSPVLSDELKYELIKEILEKHFSHVSKTTIKKMLNIAQNEPLKALLRTKQ